MSARTEPKPWDRALGESARAYRSFQTYLGMDPTDRSFGKVAAELRCSRRNVEYFAARWSWTDRTDAYDRHQDAINLARFEKMRERAARRRLERELQREEEAERVGDLLFERARTILTWPIQEEVVQESSKLTDDGQKLTIVNRIVKPAKWDLNAAVRLVEAFDRMRRSSVVDATHEQVPQAADDGKNVERKFTLYRPEDVQLPKPPEEVVKQEPEPEQDWTVDYGETPARAPEQTVW